MKKKTIVMVALLILLSAMLLTLTACGAKPEKAAPQGLDLPAPILLVPEDDKTTGKTDPQFQWSAVVGATKYTFEIKSTADNSVIAKKTYNAEARCDESACKIPAPQELAPGEYKWHVVAWIGELQTAWSEYRTLTIQ
jgi:hypothetical protein